MRNYFIAISLVLAVIATLSGCVSTGGSKSMETVVTDMHQRVTLLEEGLEPSLAELNENAAALIQRVNENDRQVRILTSMIEENQHKLDNLITMLSDLRTTLYRHWGLRLVPVLEGAGGGSSGIQIVPPDRAETVGGGGEKHDAAAPAILSPPAASEGDKQAYIVAKDLYDQENYEAAGAAFSEFMKDFPRSDQGNKAQFWIGKCYLNQSQYSQAIEAFESLRRTYPDSTYVAFALHNQAVAHFRLGEREKAIALMEEVVEYYPTTTAAGHAERDLKQLRGRQ
ncbi:MAG: tetratricopeptide repeat protein [Candidatus Hydrogenedentes bacterium]|nr:tetratricopeptide repeat protein [Candidatus Hydrogenedentota bacterium]